MDLTTLTTNLTFLSAIKFLGILIVAVFTLSLIFRLIFGRKSALNRSVCAGIGVLCVYICTIIIYTFSPGNLQQYLVPLPFVKFSGEYLYFLTFRDAGFSLLCSQILSMVILVFLYNLADCLLPDGESSITWFVLRALTIVMAMIIHYLITHWTGDFLPDLLVSYGPTILLVCLVASVLMGAVGFILGLILTVVNPIFGLLFSFFFSNKLGKQLSKAMLTTILLTGIVFALNRLGYSVISISISSLLSYLPMLVVLLGTWYFISRKL